MKKIFLLSLLTISLASCSNSGVIDCYSIKVDGFFTGTYNESTSSVYQYSSMNGEKIYTNSHVSTSEYDPDTGLTVENDLTLRVFETRFSDYFTEYTYSRKVGELVIENNFYFNTNSRIIDQEIRWIENEYPQNYEASEEVEYYDNTLAFEYAQEGYFQDFQKEYDDETETYYMTLYLDRVDSSLERHTYTQLGEDSAVTYVEKWF